jgi:hypothetical protein
VIEGFKVMPRRRGEDVPSASSKIKDLQLTLVECLIEFVCDLFLNPERCASATPQDLKSSCRSSARIAMPRRLLVTARRNSNES